MTVQGLQGREVGEEMIAVFGHALFRRPYCHVRVRVQTGGGLQWRATQKRILVTV
jgi:hypothetical protein